MQVPGSNSQVCNNSCVICKVVGWLDGLDLMSCKRLQQLESRASTGAGHKQMQRTLPAEA